MLFSLKPRVRGPFSESLELAKHADATGWDGVWIADHLMPEAGEGPMGECWTILGALALALPRVRLGSMVVGNTLRHPVIHAKMAAQVDVMSGGRFTLGLGAAWQENEHNAYGMELGSVGERSNRLEEAAALISSMFKQPFTDFDGRYYQLKHAPLDPRPVQQPLPLLIGGGGEKRTLRTVARYADAWNIWGTPEAMVEKGAILDKHCADVGRNPAEIMRSAQTLIAFADDKDQVERAAGREATILGTPAQMREAVERYAEAGVSEIIVPDFNLGTVAQKKAAFDRFMSEVVSHFR